MFYQPRDFQCPHKDSCPHLDWLSTKWVLGEYRRGKDVYSEHLRIIDKFYDSLKNRDERIRLLERENSELKAKLKMLHQKQFKANKKKGEVIGSKEIGTSSNQQTRKKRGAPVDIPDGRDPSRSTLIKPFLRLLQRYAHIAIRKIWLL